MLSHDHELIKHIFDEIDVIEELLRIKKYDQIINDRFLIRTLTRCLEVIGEASRKVSDEFRSNNPQVAWRELSDTRNKIIHDYSGVDYDVIRSIVENDLPELKFQLEKILK